MNAAIAFGVGVVFTLLISAKCDSVIRLHNEVSNKTQVSGEVEIIGEDQWHPLCARLWSISDAHVVCRTLGYPEGALQATADDLFGKPKHKNFYFIYDGLSCHGDEPDITKCHNWGKGFFNFFNCANGIAIAVCKKTIT